MNPVSKTAYFCCGVRMTDAQRKRPLCGDQFAKRFMDAEALSFYAPLAAHRGAVQCNAARHRIIDELLQRSLAQDPKLPIFVVGAGFDARPYRLRGGTWLELDEPAIIALKDERLPLAECPNALTRVGINFAEEQLADKLAPYRTNGPCVFVFEGVFLYVEESVIAETLRILRGAFPRHTLICDLMRRAFLERHSAATRTYLEQFGAYFRVVDDPYPVFAQTGRSLTQSISIAERIVELSMPRALAFLARLFPHELRDGYKVNVFELASETSNEASPASSTGDASRSPVLRLTWRAAELPPRLLSEEAFLAELECLAERDCAGLPAGPVLVEGLDAEHRLIWSGHYSNVDGLRALLRQLREERALLQPRAAPPPAK